MRGRRDPDVEVRRLVEALQDVADALDLPHAVRRGKVDAAGDSPECSALRSGREGRRADSPDQDSHACRAVGSAFAASPLRRDSLRVACRAGALATAFDSREGRLVDQNSASWNPMAIWLRRLDALSRASGPECA